MGARRSILLQPACPQRNDPEILDLLALIADSAGAAWVELDLRLDAGAAQRYCVGTGSDACAVLPLSAEGFEAVLRIGPGGEPDPTLAQLAAFTLEKLLHCRRYHEQVTLLRGALDTTTSAVLLFDADGRIVYANPPADRLLSLQTEDGLAVEGADRRRTPLVSFLSSQVEQISSTADPLPPFRGTLTLSDGSVLACEVMRVATGGAAPDTGVLAFLQPVPALSRMCLDSFCARHHVSRREQDVVCLLVEGCTTGAIAERLGISLHTVRDHLKRLYRKTGVGSRSELLSLLTTSGRTPEFERSGHGTGP